MNLEPEIRAAIEQHHIFSAEVWRSFATGLLAEVDRLRAAALGDGPALHVGTVLRIIRHGREGNIRGLEAYAGLLADKLEADGEIESAKRVRRTAAGDYGSTLRLMDGGAPLGDGWLSVEERLPEDDCDVLVVWYDGDVGIRETGHYSSVDGWLVQGVPWTVTHWRNLPNLPTK